MISENPFIPLNLPSINFDIVEERLCQISDIHFENNHAERLINQFHFKTRNMIRKGVKEGITISVDNTALDFLYATHVENMAAVGAKHKPELFFQNIDKFFERNTEYKIYVAKQNEKIVAALLLVYFKDVVEYYHQVIKQEYRILQPNSCLIFQAMVDSSVKGYNWWNGGWSANNHGALYRFKSRCNSKDYLYNYYIKFNNKEIFHSSPEELSKEYPFSYCMPFNLLKSFN